MPAHGWEVFLGHAEQLPQVEIPPDDLVPGMGEVQFRQRGDFVYFHHVMKTGGTTLSKVLQSGLGEEHLVPGSRQSDVFSKADLPAAIKENPSLRNGTTSTLWGGFAHTPDSWFGSAMSSAIPGFLSQYFRPAYSSLAALADDGNCKARRRRNRAKCLAMRPIAPRSPHESPVFHTLKLVRHPVYHVASRYAEQICDLKRRHVREIHGTRWWCRVDLAHEAAKRRAERVQECVQSGGGGETQERRSFCEGVEDQREPDPCDSTDVYMDQAHAPAMLRGLARGVCDEDTDSRPDAAGAYRECYSRLVQHLRSFLLVGVTDRMHDTTCLLSYYLAAPYTEEGNARYKACRPINVWTKTAIARLIQASRSGWAVYDAANTVLDERMAAATRHLQKLSREGVPIESLPHIGRGCFAVASSSQGRDSVLRHR